MQFFKKERYEILNSLNVYSNNITNYLETNNINENGIKEYLNISLINLLFIETMIKNKCTVDELLEFIELLKVTKNDDFFINLKKKLEGIIFKRTYDD